MVGVRGAFYLQLVLAGLSLRGRVEKVDGENLCATILAADTHVLECVCKDRSMELQWTALRYDGQSSMSCADVPYTHPSTPCNSLSQSQLRDVPYLRYFSDRCVVVCRFARSLDGAKARYDCRQGVRSEALRWRFDDQIQCGRESTDAAKTSGLGAAARVIQRLRVGAGLPFRAKRPADS